MAILTALVLCLVAAAVQASPRYQPDCTTCEYYNGIGFVGHPFYCNVYDVCYRNPHADRDGEYVYKWNRMCCPDGLKWDEEHLTCTWGGHDCKTVTFICPNETTTSLPCPEMEHPTDPTKFLNRVTWQERMCPYGTIWSQDDCTCIVGGHYEEKEPCHKLLHYGFNDTYDSNSCYNFASGEPYGNPPLTNGTLCLNGENQFLTISFLNNWFTWNPKADTFTVCMWIFPLSVDGDFGLFSTNCYFYTEDSVLELFIESGMLALDIPGQHIHTNETIDANAWSKICVTADHGEYVVYLNGQAIGTYMVPDERNVISHSAATLGFVDEDYYDLFHGYIDDFCFWHETLTADDILECYNAGPSI